MSSPAPGVMCPMMSHGGTSAGGHEMMAGMKQEMDSLMRPMHALLAFAPGALLARRDELHLDAEQVSRVRAILVRSEAEHDTAMALVVQHRQALGQSLSGGASFATVAGHFESLHWTMGQGHLALMRAAAEARALLSSGQRQIVEGT